MEWNLLEGESRDDFILRLGNAKDLIGDWQDVVDIYNRVMKTNHVESTVRKRYKQLMTWKLKDIRANEQTSEKKEYQDEGTTAFQNKLIELKQETQKVRAERLETNRWIRENARDELITDRIVQAIKTLPELEVPTPLSFDFENLNKEYCLCFGDEHYGSSFCINDLFGNVVNEYSPEIFEARMWELLNRVIEIIKKEQITTLHVFSLGDYSDGVLRVSQLMKLRYGVVEGTVMYSRFITEWLNELTKYVKVKYQQVSGNHTELRMLGQPKGTFKNENMDLIVREFIKIRLEDNSNFTFIENPTGHIYAQIATHPVLAVHGDGVKGMEKALKDYSAMYDMPIHYFICGHLHHSRTEEISKDQEVINIPSIIATDPYSESLKKTSAPAAKLLVFETVRGLVEEYKIKLIS